MIFKNKNIIDKNKLPRHVAFIVDGNGRWAKKRGLPRSVGHKFGIERVKNVIDYSVECGIEVISFYLFSTENWKRDKAEIDGIFELLRDYLRDERKSFKKNDYKITTMGDISKLPKDIVKKLSEVKDDTKDCKKIIINLALNYGGRDEILSAAQGMIDDGVKEVSLESFSKYLYTYQLPDPDLIVRTSGEERLSNFMLFQLAYSELYFCDANWPDFDKKEFEKALLNFTKRKR